MAIEIVEGDLRFSFPDGWQASKFDDWSYFRNPFQRIASGTKAMDIVAVETKAGCWLIEAKDYRSNRRTKTIDLSDEIAAKVVGTLAALASARIRANDESERNLARAALKCNDLRVVLHLEQPAKPSKLFPRAIDPAKVTQRLKQLIKAIDPHPLVVESNAMRNLAWTVH